MTSSTRRVFFGAPLATSQRSALERAAARLRAAAPGRGLRPRWSSSEGWHCTVKFIGAASPELVDELVRRASLFELPREIEVAWSGIGAFPSPRHARVLVAHLSDATGVLTDCARRFEELARACGVPAEERTYRPHVTLARLQRPTDLVELCDTTPLSGAVTLGPITLYESRLTPSGSRYEALWTAGSPQIGTLQDASQQDSSPQVDASSQDASSQDASPQDDSPMNSSPQDDSPMNDTSPDG